VELHGSVQCGWVELYRQFSVWLELHRQFSVYMGALACSDATIEACVTVLHVVELIGMSSCKSSNVNSLLTWLPIERYLVHLYILDIFLAALFTLSLETTEFSHSRQLLSTPLLSAVAMVMLLL